MIVGTHPGMVLTFTLFHFSEAETSVAVTGTLCGAVRDNDLGKPELFGSFFLFFYLPVGPRRYPCYDHNVGGSRLWDGQLTFQTSYEP